MSDKATRRAFTIIELLVVVSLILILLAAAAYMIENALQNQRDAVRISAATSLGKAMDEAVAATGSVPRLVGDTVPQGVFNTAYRFCAVDLLDAANTNKLDLGLFSGQAIPVDPLPASRYALTGHCDGYPYGYVVHTQYQTGGKPAQATACSSGLFAFCQNVTYSIEVGLENQHTDGPLRSPSQLSISGYTAPDPSRFPYLLNGAACPGAYAAACYR